MNRQEQLVFCKKCTRRKMDFKQGLICEISNEKADFIDNCLNFNLDTSVKESLDTETPLEHAEAIAQIPESAIESLRTEQNLSKGIIAGTVTGIIGALLWGTITVLTNFQIGYMAIAIGAAVGYSFRYFGKGIDQIYGILGAFTAIISCVLGNFFSIIGFIANNEGLSYIDTLVAFDYSLLGAIMSETFNPMDLLFYGIAAYEGYKFSFRSFTEADLASLK